MSGLKYRCLVEALDTQRRYQGSAVWVAYDEPISAWGEHPAYVVPGTDPAPTPGSICMNAKKEKVS